MPLKGQAKTDYQRDYMRRRRSNASVRPTPLEKVLDPGLIGILDSVEHAELLDPDKPRQEKIAQLREMMANPDAPQSQSSPVKEEGNGTVSMGDVVRLGSPQVVKPLDSARDKPRAPLYRRGYHKQGDKVRMPGSDQEVIVPELDELVLPWKEG